MDVASENELEIPEVAPLILPEKKKSSFGWIAFAVVAGVLTLGAVNVFRNNN
jgi:hypothetical protein